MTYSQKLRDPRWQKKRLQILERDGWKCQCCGSEEKNLQVHHVFYAKCDPWEYEDEAYQTLCEDCHNERHENIFVVLKYVSIFLKDIPTENICQAASAMLLAGASYREANSRGNSFGGDAVLRVLSAIKSACKLNISESEVLVISEFADSSKKLLTETSQANKAS